MEFVCVCGFLGDLRVYVIINGNSGLGLSRVGQIAVLNPAEIV